MSPRPGLQTIVAAALRASRRDAQLAIAGAVLAMIAALFVVSWLLADLSWWPAPSVAPLLLELGLVALAGGFSYWALRLVQAQFTERRVATAGEDALGLPQGSVRGVLELSRALPEGTSISLYTHAEAALDRDLVTVSPATFAGQLGARIRRQRMQSWSVAAALTVALLLLGFASPARSRAGWAPLLNPVRHLSPPPLPPIIVEPGNTDLARGADLRVTITAPQRETVLLEWRSAGSLVNDATVELSGGAGAAVIPQVDATVYYWVTAPDGAVSDTFTIRPIDPLLVSELLIEVTYPAYLSRPTELFQSELPSLEIPEGTELRIRGRATRDLGSAELMADTPSVLVPLAVAGAAFSGRWVPRASGLYQWQLRSPNGTRAELVPAPFELTVVPDLAPEIEVTFPGVDTTLTAELQQNLIADARDDHGLLGATLVSWRTSSAGVKDPVVEEPLTLEGEADRALIRGLIDARDRKLLPGDTLSYFIRLTDNAPRRQTTVSRTFKLRLPSMNELRDEAGNKSDDIEKGLDQLARTARELEKATRDLNRRSAGETQSRNDRTGQGASQGNPGDKQMDFNKSEQTRSLLERQQQMLGQVDQMREQTAALERAMEAAGLKDPELQKRLAEMRDLYDKMLTPELKKKLEELKRGVDQQDPEQVKKALEEMARQQQEMREQLERSLELMRRAAAEQEMNALSQEAKELATQQQAVAEQMKQNQPDKEKVEQQKQMEERTKELSKQLEELMKKLGQQGEAQAAKQTGEAQEKTEGAAEDMKKAGEQAGKQQGQQAAKSGEQAAQKLNDAAKGIDGARKEMAEGWKKETQETLEKATSDALSMAQKQNEILEKLQQAQKDAQASKKPEQQPGQAGAQPPQLPQPGGQQQQGQQGAKPPQPGQQQGGQQQAGQQKSGQQQGGQQQGGQQGQQQGGQPQQQGKQPGQQQGQQQQQGSPQGQQPGGQGAGGQSGDMQQIKNDQAAVKQGLEQLGKNLSEAGQKSAQMNRDVGSALGRANLSMEQTLKAMEEAGRMPTQEAAQTLDALNRLALELLKNQQQVQDAQAGSGLQQALEQLAELAKQQGGVNGQSSSLAPLNVSPQSMAEQLSRLAKEQRQIAQKLDGMNNIGGREDVLGRLDELAKEANQLARELEGGRLNPQTLARQERLFHRLLDAGRTLERDEFDEERKADRPGMIPPHLAKALKPGLLDESLRFKVPTEQELRGMPPAMRRLMLDYIELLNRTAPPPEKKENR